MLVKVATGLNLGYMRDGWICDTYMHHEENYRCWSQHIQSQIAKFIGPTTGPPGSCRPQMGPMLAPWTLLSGVRCHYKAVNFHQNSHKIHGIARPPLGLEMGCFLCGQIFIYIWPQSLQRCMQYHVILYHVITASDCICNTMPRWIKQNLSIQQWIILYFFIWNCWLLTL